MPARFYNPFPTFTVRVTSNVADPCMAGALSTFTARSSNAAVNLQGAQIVNATLFRMPENTLLTGYRYVTDADGLGRYNIDPTTAVLGGNACD
jgi:hypothetical protein